MTATNQPAAAARADVRPLLFLDVDGVVSALGGTPDLNVLGAPVRWPDNIAAHVQELDLLFRVVWATSWETTARALHVYLQVGKNWPVLEYDEHKLPALLAYAGAQPWAWVDDELELEAGERQADLTGFLLIPDSQVGLTDEHMQALRVFATSART